MSLQNDNIGDRGAVALAAAVKALFVTTFFVIVRTVCSLGLDLFISCTDDSVPLVCGVGKPCFRVTKELMFCCMCGQHFAHAERFLRNWRSMCCIAVVFSEAACLMSADQRYFSAKTDQIHNAFMHTLYFLRVDNIRINPSKVCAQNWHDGAIRKRVLVGRVFRGHGDFCSEIEHVVSQRGRFGEVVGNMKEPGQGTSSEDLDTSFLHAARQMAG